MLNPEKRDVIVSIHAPEVKTAKRFVSIHAPARSATKCCATPRPPRGCFNSRARKERDKAFTIASVKAARFNSRARKERDSKYADQYTQFKVSIHAPARGATTMLNPEKRDVIVSIHAPEVKTAKRSVSIHAPARSATKTRKKGLFRQFVSIHAPARSATVIFFDISIIQFVSIHAPARSATVSVFIALIIGFFKAFLRMYFFLIRILSFLYKFFATF